MTLLSAPAVLIVDAATYAFSFIVIFAFVRVGKRVAPDESSRGVFAGLRYLLHHRLLGPMLAAASFINFAAQGLLALIPVIVLRRYDLMADHFVDLSGTLTREQVLDMLRRRLQPVLPDPERVGQ